MAEIREEAEAQGEVNAMANAVYAMAWALRSVHTFHTRRRSAERPIARTRGVHTAHAFGNGRPYPRNDPHYTPDVRPAASTGVWSKCLREVRDARINGDTHASPPRKPWSRNYVNSQIHRLCRMFKWAASHEMIPADVFERLKTVPALRRGRTVARETAPVRSVPIETVAATRP